MSALANEDPRRWRSASPGTPDPDVEIGAAVRRAAVATPVWDDLRVAHVRQKILRAVSDDRAAPAASGPARRRLRTWALAIGCVLLGAVTSALAGMVLSRLHRRPAAPSAEGGAAHTAHQVGRRTRLSSSDAVEGPVDDDASVLQAPAESRPRVDATPARRALRPRGTLASPRPPALARLPDEASRQAAPAPVPAGEAQDLAGAIQILRRDNDAAEALARLDEHDRLYPAGVLAHEAALARVEALLALGRDGAALHLLDGLGLDGDGTDRRALLARAELRAAAGRCADAGGDFARARGVGPDAHDELAARALYGDGVCRLRTGDVAGARAAFEAYLRAFPDGPRRDEVDRALHRIAP